MRPFQEMKNYLPTRITESLSKVGISHYLALLKFSDGVIYQFEFGPPEGEAELFGVTVLGQRKEKGEDHRSLMRSGVKGEVHLEQIPVLPDNCVKIGFSERSMSEVINFISNISERDLVYCLHKNDCRHFLNRICEVSLTENRLGGRKLAVMILKEWDIAYFGIVTASLCIVDLALDSVYCFFQHKPGFDYGLEATLTDSSGKYAKISRSCE